MIDVKSKLSEIINSGDTPPPPDYRFGYTYNDLYEWHSAIGPEGCLLYRKHSPVDLWYMQTYALIGAAFLLQQLRPSGLNPKFALLFPMSMTMDILETCIPAYLVRVCDFSKTVAFPNCASGNCCQSTQLDVVWNWHSGTLHSVCLQLTATQHMAFFFIRNDRKGNRIKQCCSIRFSCQEERVKKSFESIAFGPFFAASRCGRQATNQANCLHDTLTEAVTFRSLFIKRRWRLGLMV